MHWKIPFTISWVLRPSLAGQRCRTEIIVATCYSVLCHSWLKIKHLERLQQSTYMWLPGSSFLAWWYTSSCVTGYQWFPDGTVAFFDDRFTTPMSLACMRQARNSHSWSRGVTNQRFCLQTIEPINDQIPCDWILLYIFWVAPDIIECFISNACFSIDRATHDTQNYLTLDQENKPLRTERSCEDGDTN